MINKALVMGMMLAVGGGCTVAVTEAQMQDRAQVSMLAQKVSTAQNNKAHVKRVAFIGAETVNQIQEQGAHWSPGGNVGMIIDMVAAMKAAEEKRKMLACRALDSSFDGFSKSLTDAGFELVPFEEKLRAPEFQLFTGVALMDWCQASRAPARLNILNPFKWKDTFRIVQQLIDALGVDGIVMAQVGANGLESGESVLNLYVKSANGYAVVGWSGRVSKGKFKFEAAQPGKTDEARLTNAVRVFTHSFDLLAAKMGAEAKP